MKNFFCAYGLERKDAPNIPFYGLDHRTKDTPWQELFQSGSIGKLAREWAYIVDRNRLLQPEDSLVTIAAPTPILIPEFEPIEGVQRPLSSQQLKALRETYELYRQYIIS